VAGVAVVTGASGGIGRELAMLLARAGFDLVLIGRRQEELERLASTLEASIRVKTIVGDLADPRAPKDIDAELRDSSLVADILVNSAGFALHGAFAETDASALLDLLQVNVVTVTHLTRLLLPGMVERGGGRILNVASTAAFASGPSMAVYYASKGYVLALSEAISEELRGTGVTVTALCPGPTVSGFQARAGLERSRLFKSGVMDAAAVAKAGYRGMLKGKPVVVPGWRNAVLAQSYRALPRRVSTRAVRWLLEDVG
jgi:uncharacterized protein